MKKVVVFLLSSILSISAFSQDFSLYIQGGLNYSNLLIKTPDEWESLDNTLGINSGLGLDIILDDKLEIQSGLIYNTVGADNLRLKYLYLPVMISPFRINDFSFQTGLQFAYLLNQGSEIAKLVRDYDITFSIGFKQRITENIGVGVRYSITFNDIQENDSGTTDLKNSFWNFYGLYYIDL